MTAALNPQRGEAALVIDGTPRRLCLTLGALAEIEAALGVEAGAGLGARLQRLSAHDLLRVLAALLRGGGEPADVESLARAAIAPGDAAQAIAAAFARAAGGAP